MGNKGQLLLSQYAGSKSLSFLCALTSMSIDQINFIACQLFALLLSFILKNYVKNPNSRLIYCLISGIFVCYFCFGLQIFHVITPAGLSYLVIRQSKSVYMPWYVFAVSMTYLSFLHLARQFYEFANGYSLDITGPLMVLTQKVTSLAFAVGDGKKQKQDKRITELQQSHAIGDAPGTLEFWSYIFQFQSMLAGPLVFFGDYREFIYSDESPNSLCVVLKKMGWSIFFALLYIKVAPQYDIELLRDEDFLKNTSIFYKMFYITLATTLERTKYYHAWILSDAVCNASGLGYNKAKKSWDLITNVEAIQFELGLNMKESLDLWNKGTMRWLRYVIYERFSPDVRTWVTYGASAIWHGYFPGYYITFLSGALFTSSARIIRRTIRPFFLDNPVYKAAYDFVTWFTTRLIVAYVSFSFVLLDFVPSVVVYMRLYFFFHIAAASAMVVLPRVTKNMGKSNAAKRPSTASNSYNHFIERTAPGIKRSEFADKSNGKSFVSSSPNHRSFETTGYENGSKMKTG